MHEFMQGMMLNYILILILGIGFVIRFIRWRRTGIFDNRLLRPIIEAVVLILVIIATIMGYGFMDFRQLLAF